VFGLEFLEKLRAHLSYPGHKDPEYAGCTAFLVTRLKGTGQ
jgi:hypothetical protein